MLTDCWNSFVERSADDNPTDDISLPFANSMGVSQRQRVDKKKKDWSHPEGAIKDLIMGR